MNFMLEKMKIKYKEIGPGGAFSKWGVPKTSPGQAQPITSSSTSDFQKTRAPCTIARSCIRALLQKHITSKL